MALRTGNGADAYVRYDNAGGIGVTTSDAVTIIGAGQLNRSSADVSTAPATSAGSATVGNDVSGSLAATTAAATSSASASVLNRSSAAVSTAAATVAASGDIIVSGLLESTLAGATLAASGLVSPHITSELDRTTGNATASAFGFIGDVAPRSFLGRIGLRIGLGL